ncbi:MAG TPA: hypothetical protein VG500_12450 [Gemmatimonadales bacterium]|nr:hypothetical protein [Gemmatimonadales bacterium]
MDFGGLLVLGIVWLIFNLISMGKGNARPRPRTTQQRPGTRPPTPVTTGGAADATQREGSMLERLLRELEQNLEQVGGTLPPKPARVPGTPPRDEQEIEEEIEERESLEEPARVVSLEHEVHRPQREAYDQDTGAEGLVQRRIDAARTRDRALTKADHKAFDARIRQEPADHTAVRRYTPAQLRDAFVWREILGPPVSERDPLSP